MTHEKLNRVRSLLSAYRFNVNSEADLQVAIASILEQASYSFQREFRLSAADRLDFLVDGELVIETKIGGSGQAVLRQLSRYALNDQVKAILLVTNRANHFAPDSFNGKPCAVHSLLESAF